MDLTNPITFADLQLISYLDVLLFNNFDNMKVLLLDVVHSYRSQLLHEM